MALAATVRGAGISWPTLVDADHMMNQRSIALGLLLGATSLFAQKELTNQDIWFSPAFGVERVGGLNSMKDGLRYTVQEEEGGVGAVNIYDYKSGNKTGTLFSAKDLGAVEMEGYSLSGDEQRAMIETATQPLYRYSYYAHHFVYDLKTKNLKALSDKPTCIRSELSRYLESSPQDG